jgi:fructose-specific component phosphotransferase system IIB-like protein
MSEKDLENGVIEVEGKRLYRIVRPSDRAEFNLVVQDVQAIDTKFGRKILVIDKDGNAIILNQTMINKFLGKGITNSDQLKGKTLYLQSKEVLVRGNIKKMYDLKGVE